ncbi:MAG TPA: tetratricopeptide repeat protein [Kofleriaceae bacterium]|nr:tetratricopeptide repeat protein [Kofleriaceae bacterium]
MAMRFWILIALLLYVLATPAWADDPALAPPKALGARLHFKQGNRLYRARKLEEAIAQYHAGAAIEPTPVFDYNLGQCYRKLGRRADALRHYERFLESGRPTGELRDLVAGFVRQLREELTPKATAQPPATITPAPAVTPAPAPAPAPARRAGATPSPAATLSSSAVARRERWYADRLGWSLVAGGIAVASGALYLRASAVGLHDDAGLTPDEGRRSELHDAAQLRNIVGVALGAGSALLLAAGAIKLAVHRGGPERARAASLRFAISERGVAVLGQF